MIPLAFLLLVLQTPLDEDAWRTVPADAVRPSDERPALLVRRSLLEAVLATELKALDREQAVLGAEAAERQARVAADRRGMTALRDQLRRVTLPASARVGELLLVDRYLDAFARDRLRRTGPDVALLEAWRAANERFLESGDLAERDRALPLRAAVLAALSRGSVLQGIIHRLAHGPVSQPERLALVALVEKHFPGELPLGTAAGAAGSGAIHPPAERPPDPALPRLDGGAHPIAEIDRLADLQALMTGGR